MRPLNPSNQRVFVVARPRHPKRRSSSRVLGLKILILWILVFALSSIHNEAEAAQQYGQSSFTFSIHWGRITPSGGLEHDLAIWSNPELLIFMPQLKGISPTFIGLQGVRRSDSNSFNSFSLSMGSSNDPFLTTNWDLNLCPFGPRFEWRLNSDGYYNVYLVNETNRPLWLTDNQGKDWKGIILPGNPGFSSSYDLGEVSLHVEQNYDVSTRCANISWSLDPELRRRMGVRDFQN